MRYIFIFTLGIFFRLHADECKEIRAAYDLGSTSIKMAVAKVDHCNKKIHEVLFRANRKIDFQEDLNRSKSGNLSRKIIWKALTIISELHELSRSLKPQRSLVVASSVFNKALNTDDLIVKLWRWLKIPLIILTQKQKGEIGFEAVNSSVQTPRDQIAVWEIGGGSMQFTCLIDQSSEPLVFEGFLASASFKKILIEKIQNRNSSSVTSPNPISPQEGIRALEFLKNYAVRVPPVIRAKLTDPRTKVYGIGGVHSYSLADQLGMPVYDLEAIRDVLNGSYNLSDHEIGGEYYETQISNLLLVAGFMQNLNISEVYSLDISMVNGVLVSDSYWQHSVQN